MKKTFTIFLAAIMMVTFMPLDTGSYAFAASVTYESEPNDELWQANTWDIYSSDTFKGAFDDSDSAGWKTDYIKFSLNESCKIRFTAKHSTCDTGTGYGIAMNLYSDVDITDAYRRRILNCSYRKGLGYCYGEQTIYLSKGAYYLELIITEYVKEYEIHAEIENLEDDFNEPNDYIESATSIALGNEYHGILSYAAMVPGKDSDEHDQDAMCIKVPQDGKYYVNFAYSDPENGDILLDEYNKRGDRLYKIKGDEKKRGKRYGFTEQITLKKGAHYFIASTYPTRLDYHGCQYSITISPKLSKVSKVKASKLGSGKVNLSWSTKAGADGYRIYRLNPNTGKYAYIGKSKTTSFVDNKARRGITNLYKVKAYRMKNGSREDGYFSDVVKGKA